VKTTFYKTVKHFIPEINGWLGGVDDPRNQRHNTYRYPAGFVLWVGIVMYVCKLGSRRQINFELRTDAVLKNINMMAKTSMEVMPDHGTVGYLLENLAVKDLSGVRYKIINHLIRNKCFNAGRLYGDYLIVIDGSQMMSSSVPHCMNCLTREKDGVLSYHHDVLEAKLITPGGLAISIETEFIENSYPEDTFDINSGLEAFHRAHRETQGSKQDCELRAFYRLIQRLKTTFPQLSICLLLDALFANQHVLALCAKHNWHYIINFKEGSLPATWQEYLKIKEINPGNHGAYKTREGVQQEFQWANGIDFQGHTLNALECTEITDAGKKTFVWMTNFEVTNHNYPSIGNKGGRLRWIIENQAFNTQKNGGYNMEHPYSQDPVGMKNFYMLLQIAHIINQLIEKGSLIPQDIYKSFGSIANIARRLLESLRTTVFNPAELRLIDSAKFQIRLRSP
jgi:hypothetical protein